MCHAPELDVGDLRNLLHDELGLEDRVVERNVLNRELLRWQDLTELVRPLLPGERAPEVVYPEKPALEQIESQPFRLFIGEPDCPDVGRHRERTLKQLIVCEPHDVVI